MVTIALFVANTCTVDGGERVVLWDRFAGVKPEVIGEGTHFLIPGIQKPQVFDIRTKPRVITTTTGSKGVNFCFLVCNLARPSNS